MSETLSIWRRPSVGPSWSAPGRISAKAQSRWGTRGPPSKSGSRIVSPGSPSSLSMFWASRIAASSEAWSNSTVVMMMPSVSPEA